MIFEMTRDYSIIVPLMISNLISFMVSYRLQRQPIYEALAHQEGVTLPSDEVREQISRLQTGKVMRAPGQVLSPDDPLTVARKVMLAAGTKRMVVAGEGSIWGVLTRERLEAGEDGSGARVRDLITPEETFASVHIDEPLSLALERMGSEKADMLPVVSRANSRQLLGMVTLPEVLSAYGIGEGRL
jgi:CIC family chloride channel protein